MVGRARFTATALSAALYGVGVPVYGFDSAAIEQAERAAATAEARLPELRDAVKAAERRGFTVEERVIAGELHLRNRNFGDAIRVLSQVVELHRQGKASSHAAADAEMLLGEAYFRDSQLLSAKRHYAHILDNGKEKSYSLYAGRALGRMVDVALRVENPAVLDQALAYLEHLPESDEDGSVAYARGKVLYAAGRLGEAHAALGLVPRGSTYVPQAGYLAGVVLMKQAPAPSLASSAHKVEPPAIKSGEARSKAEKVPRDERFDPAIKQFLAVTEVQVTTDSQKHVVDLAWMAVARLLYEVGDNSGAAAAYGKIERSSVEFPKVLYELAWVYAREGDFERAQRALEVLAITHPEGLEMADGSLLHADLMLRSGRFEKALGLYRSVRRRFEPIRSELRRFIDKTTEPAVYYDELLAERVDEFTSARSLSPVVIDWARQEVGDSRAFAVVDDISRSHLLVRDSRRIALQLRAVLGSATRVKAFSEIRRPYERVLALSNQLAHAQMALARGLEAEASAQASGTLGALIREQRELMVRLGRLPVSQGDFSRRESQGEEQWNQLSQQLQRLTLEVDQVQATTNALRRVVSDSESLGVNLASSARQRFQDQIAANDRDLQLYKNRLAALRQLVELGRVQVGFGDQRFVEDARLRSRFAMLTKDAFRRAAAGEGGEDAAEFAREGRRALARVMSQSKQTAGLLQALEVLATARTSEVIEEVEAERRKVEAYAEQLDALDQQARLLVGELALQTFVQIHERLKSIVIRADVGIVQQAWELREGQRARVRALQRERAREEQQLNEELGEVLDDEEDTL